MCTQKNKYKQGRLSNLKKKMSEQSHLVKMNQINCIVHEYCCGRILFVEKYELQIIKQGEGSPSGGCENDLLTLGGHLPGYGQGKQVILY